jgi:transglutaminase-like putative cysteine protease
LFLRISHRTRYDYSHAVSFAPHALYLRPRETSRNRLHDFALQIEPAARRVATTDPLDNALDWAYFAPGTLSNRLDVQTNLMVETLDENPFDFILRPDAFTVPFDYEPAERSALAPGLTLRADSPPAADLRGWVSRFLPSPPQETVAFLMALNNAVHRALSYAARDEEGIQSAGETIAMGSGSCRDYALLMIELLRAHGLAARFVSGYVFEPAAVGPSPSVPSAMHAWAEVYLPGAGWRGLDAARDCFCDDAFVPVAHAAVAEIVSPIQGTFSGPADTTSRMTTSLAVERL